MDNSQAPGTDNSFVMMSLKETVRSAVTPLNAAAETEEFVVLGHPVSAIIRRDKAVL